MRLGAVAGNQGGEAVNGDVYGVDERKTKRGGGRERVKRNGVNGEVLHERHPAALSTADTAR